METSINKNPSLSFGYASYENSTPVFTLFNTSKKRAESIPALILYKFSITFRHIHLHLQPYKAASYHSLHALKYDSATQTLRYMVQI